LLPRMLHTLRVVSAMQFMHMFRIACTGFEIAAIGIDCSGNFCLLHSGTQWRRSLTLQLTDIEYDYFVVRKNVQAKVWKKFERFERKVWRNYERHCVNLFAIVVIMLSSNSAIDFNTLRKSTNYQLREL